MKMTIQTSKTDSEIKAEIIETLSHTRYACSNIEELNSGNINFTYISIVDWDACEYGKTEVGMLPISSPPSTWRIIPTMLRW